MRHLLKVAAGRIQQRIATAALIAALLVLGSLARAEVTIPTAAQRAEAAKVAQAKHEAALREAAGNGDARAMFDLAAMLQARASTPENAAEVHGLFVRSADGGDWRAMGKLADEYSYGAAKDEARAKEWEDKAGATIKQKADAGDALAMGELASESASIKKFDDAAVWYRKSAEAGEPGSWFALGILYFKHGKDIGKDPQEGWTAMQKGAEAGDILAMLYMGRHCIDGKPSQKDVASALAWYGKAADLGSAQAMLSIARMYRLGKVMPADAEKAIEWYLKAAVAEGEGLMEIADMYAKGDGVKKDDALALQWIRKAAETGDPEGMSALGLRYEKGDGVKTDLPEAQRWYSLAVDAGDSAAVQGLVRLGVERTPPAMKIRSPESHLDKTRLSDAIAFLTDVTGMNIFTDWRGLEKAGVTENTPVTIFLHQMTAGDALAGIIEAAGHGKVNYAVVGGIVIISTPEGIKSRVALRKRHVAKPIDAALNRQLPRVALDGAGIDAAFDFLREAGGLKIEVDWNVLKTSGVEMTTPLTLKLTDTSLGIALETILYAAGGNPPLDYEIRKGEIIITTGKPAPK